MVYFAHSSHSLDDTTWQTLRDHLDGVANLAREFADSFDAGDWAYVAGLWHDLGKYHPDWQAYLRRSAIKDDNAHIENSHGRPNHSTAGAVLSMETDNLLPPSRILAYLIAGHHAGLPDWIQDRAGGDLQNRLFDTLNDTLLTKELNAIRAIPDAQDICDHNLPPTPPLNISSSREFEERQEHFHLWIRMLFSCLVDADFLDTEKFLQPEKTIRRNGYVSLRELKTRFDEYMIRKQKAVAESPLNRKRAEVLNACRAKAMEQPGFFSLTVPTGGGKTLSSMAFALEHALKHGKRRIIVAIPYTSIIEQTAKVFKYGTDDDEEIGRRIASGDVLFGEDQVVEHHSNLDPDEEDARNRLASENWDAPIIVTTNVQLFESLFASRTSACRKLHNLADSIIILDEAQMLEPEFLAPILSVLKGLVDHFGVTVVLMTATQPALEGKIGRAPVTCAGLDRVTGIIENPQALADALQRVSLELPPDLDARMSWAEIRDRLLEHEQALCIVNSRKDCRDLHALMPEGTIHLSASMCGEERSEIISGIKSSLRAGMPVRVISTQLIEAGVDIDFPVVFRAMAGLDSIAQAAGRCNREMKMPNPGKVVVFNPPRRARIGLLHKGEDACLSILRTMSIQGLPPSIFQRYFEHFYSSVNTFDKPGFHGRLVRDACGFALQFRTFAQEFKLIEDGRQVIVWWKSSVSGLDSRGLIRELRFHGPDWYLVRKLRRFTVSIPENCFKNLEQHGWIEDVRGFWTQCVEEMYRPGLGVMCNGEMSPQDLIV
jgi:CRISPR-associated endonuclease/helicase Cas3